MYAPIFIQKRFVEYAHLIGGYFVGSVQFV